MPDFLISKHLLNSLKIYYLKVMIIFETDFQLFLYKPIVLDYFIGLYYFNCLKTGLLHVSGPFSIFTLRFAKNA